jgi:hypothetical protein
VGCIHVNRRRLLGGSWGVNKGQANSVEEVKEAKETEVFVVESRGEK